MNLYHAFHERLGETPLAHAVDRLPDAVRRGFEECGHGDLDRWLAAIEALPHPPHDLARRCDLGAVTARGSLAPAARRAVEAALRTLVPWRKGPFELFGVTVDAEWRSWMKWNRIAPHLDFSGRRVLDVGCGNGYYGWRMLGAGAAQVIGIDPTPLYVAQFHAVRRLLDEDRAWVLPLADDDLADLEADFDLVLSLGVLYHRPAPIEHLRRLRRWVRPGGQVLVETLVVEGGTTTVFTPPDRYARMRNVWFIPSPAVGVRWLERAGFHRVRVLDVSVTSVEEQRRTPWMPFHSLAEFLDPGDPTRTVEGHPAPRRALLLARA